MNILSFVSMFILLYPFTDNIIILQSVIKKKYGQDATNVGDEGGFAPNIQVRKYLIFNESLRLLYFFIILYASKNFNGLFPYTALYNFSKTRRVWSYSRLPLRKLVTPAK